MNLILLNKLYYNYYFITEPYVGTQVFRIELGNGETFG